MAREIKEVKALTDEDLMPSGKHKGTKMEDVPAKYLLYVYDNHLLSSKPVIMYIENNMDILREQALNE